MCLRRMNGRTIIVTFSILLLVTNFTIGADAGWTEAGKDFKARHTIDPDDDGFEVYTIRASEDEDIKWTIKVIGSGSVKVYFCDHNVSGTLVLLGAIQYLQRFSEPDGVRETSHKYDPIDSDKGTYSLVVVPAGSSEVTYDITISVKEDNWWVLGLAICCLPGIIAFIVLVVIGVISSKNKKAVVQPQVQPPAQT